jgi:hypothetical protein
MKMLANHALPRIVQTWSVELQRLFVSGDRERSLLKKLTLVKA